MYKILGISMFALAMVALVACSPSTTIPDSSVPTEWTAEVNDIPIRYVIQRSVTFNDREIGVWSEWTNGECRMEIRTAYARDMDSEGLAQLVAGCYDLREQFSADGSGESPFDTPEEAYAYQRRYAALFEGECGTLEALGWERASDGECASIPAFEEAL